MKGGVRPKTISGGFTIVETMMVLAITGALLIAAMALISHRQAQTQFAQGIQQLQSRLQQDMNDVGNGYYPNDGNISCIEGITGPVLRIAATPQGTNSSCIFLGKVVQFGVDTNTDAYNTFTIVGLKGDVLDPSPSLAVAKPRLIARGSTEDTPSSTVPDVYEKAVTPYGLTVVNMYYGNDPTANHVGAVAFIIDLNGTSGANDSRQVDVAAIPGTNFGSMSKDALVDAANVRLRALPAAAVNPPDGVHICFKSAGTNQSALLNIGGQGKQSTITVDVKENGSCS